MIQKLGWIGLSLATILVVIPAHSAGVEVDVGSGCAMVREVAPAPGTLFRWFGRCVGGRATGQGILLFHYQHQQSWGESRGRMQNGRQDGAWVGPAKHGSPGARASGQGARRTAARRCRGPPRAGARGLASRRTAESPRSPQ